MKHESHGAYRGFKLVPTRLDTAEMRQCDGYTDGAMPAHAQVSGVIEEDGGGRTCGVGWLKQECADQHIGAARLAKDGAPVVVEVAAQYPKPLSERSIAKLRKAADNTARGLSRGMGVDDFKTRRDVRIGHGG